MLQSCLGCGSSRSHGFPPWVGAKVQRPDIREPVSEELEDDLGKVLDELYELTVRQPVVYLGKRDPGGLRREMRIRTRA